MPQHKVHGSIQVLELNQAGSAIELNVFADDKKLGTIALGQGSFRWKNKNGKKFRSKSWTEFFDLLDKIDDYL